MPPTLETGRAMLRLSGFPLGRVVELMRMTRESAASLIKLIALRPERVELMPPTRESAAS